MSQENSNTEAYAGDGAAVQAKLGLARKIVMLLAIALLLLSAVLNLWTYLENVRLRKSVEELGSQELRARRQRQFLAYLHQQLTSLGKTNEPVRTLMKKHEFSFSGFGIISEPQENAASSP